MDDGRLRDLSARLVARAYGPGTAVARVERMGPWCVARAHLVADGTGPPSSAVVKWPRADLGSGRTGPARFWAERASLEFLGQLGPLGLRSAPRLLAVDEAAEALLLEDLAPRVALSDLLATGDPRGPAGLVAFARALGALHAGTAGQADRFYTQPAAGPPSTRLLDRRRVVGSSWGWELRWPDDLGVGPPAGAEAEMAAVRGLLLEPGPWDALSNGDAGANNFLIDGDDGRIIDWETGGYRHALVDAACLYVPGPMWMTVAEPSDELEAAYRNALASGVDQGSGPDFGLGLAAACMAMAIERLERLEMLERRPPGHDSRAQMVFTLESAARAAHRFGAFPLLTAWARATTGSLRRRWSDADREMPAGYTRRG